MFKTFASTIKQNKTGSLSRLFNFDKPSNIKLGRFNVCSNE